MALPPRTLSRRPKGVSTVSMPMEPVTKRDIVKLEDLKLETRNADRSRSARELADFYSGGGDRVKPAGRKPLVTLEKPVDGIILLDVAAFEVEVDDGAAERLFLSKRSVGQGGVGGEDIPLFFLGGVENVRRRGVGGQLKFVHFVDLMLVPLERFADGGSHWSIQEPLHGQMVADYFRARNSSAIPPYSRRSSVCR